MKLASAIAYNKRHRDLPGCEEAIAYLTKQWQDAHGLVPDGELGPLTINSIVGALGPPPVQLNAMVGGVWTPFDGPLSERPKTRADVRRMFGNPGKGKADVKWERENIITVQGDTAFLPVLTKTWFPVNRKVEPYMREAFRRAEVSVPGYIQKPGTFGYVFRHMRHDDDLPLSNHAYGIACDINPQDNGAKEFGPGKTPVPWSDAWNRYWPRGIPKAIVDAFLSCGFSWGGYWKGFCDPMHFEWCGQREVQV
jgi:hypothetical protein